MTLIVTLIAISLLGSLFAGALFYLLKILQKKIGNKLFIVLTSAMMLGICSLLVPVEALFLLIFFIALAAVYYLTRQQDIIIILVWLTVYFIIAQLTLTAVSIINDSCGESSQMVKCASNLKRLGVALFMYSEDNNGHFPDKDGDAGLDMLRQQNYLTDYNVYLCPSTSDSTPASGPVKSSYIYHGGLTFNPTEKNILMEDKPGNHNGYRNRLYCNATVNGYSDPNYRDPVKEPIIKRLINWLRED
ncbi:MAG: hypothetical protein L3J71_07125 [Victivallaceae bacterium]|nr:hypothetical protein [Victivallaceae bacterium]